MPVIVVGVTPHQPPVVITEAARIAQKFQAVLVCAHVEPGNYVITEHPDGSVESLPMDPDQPEWDNPVFDQALTDRIRHLVVNYDVTVEFRELAGEIAHALGRLAEVLHAEMIVVGSRRGMRSSVHDFFLGSAAVHLAHRQPRPVLVVPVAPVPHGQKLPWEGRRP